VTDIPRSFKLFLVGVFVFGMGDFAHTLLILRATQVLTPIYGVAKAESLAISLYVAHNILYALAAYPVGALSDKLGRRELLALGYLLSGVMGIGFILAPPGFGYLLILFVLGGIYIAVEDALEGSTAAELLPEEVRGTGYGMLATVNGIGDFVSSLVVGFLWSTVSPSMGFGYAAVLSILGALVIYKF
jgi:MFS family permease